MKIFKTTIHTLTILAFLFAGSGCDNRSIEYKQERQTNKLQKEADKRLGMPNITNFTEKRFAKELMELRDKEIKTYTYIIDMNGRFHLICKSIGYGMPYSTQYTNPKKSRKGGYVLPQAEANGLYMPENAAATFVMCLNKKSIIKPVYIEQNIIVSPFKLN